MTSMERVLNALTEHGCAVSGSGAQVKAQCPAHDDRVASLSVKYGDSKVAMYCQAGCATETVLDELRLSWPDLYDEPRQRDGNAGPRVVAEYPYRDEQGNLLFTVKRYEPGFDGERKTFRPYKPGADRPGIKGVRRVLYRLPELLAAVKTGQHVYIVEGEKDADELARRGLAATCNLNGASKAGQRPKWDAADGALFAGADVTVIADRDNAGYAHAGAIVASLTGKASSVRVVRAAIDVDHADVSDHLAAGLSLDALEVADLREFPDTSDTPSGGVSETAGIPDQGEQSGSDTSDGSDTGRDADALLLAGLRNGAWLDAQTFPPLRYAITGLIPEGFTLLIGPPKAGKSFLLCGLLLGRAAGGRALGQIPLSKADVLYLALEDGDRRMQARCRMLLRTADGNAEPIPASYHYLTQVEPGQVIATVEAFLRAYPDTAMVVLDTLGKVMPQAGPGESAYQRDYRVGGALKRIADQHPGLSLIVVHHDRKAASADFVDSVSGTNGLAGAADTIIVLARERQSTAGLLKVTGRDVVEEEYAVRMIDGTTWVLDGRDLLEAAANAKKRRDETQLSGTSAEIIDYVRQHPDGVTAKQVRDQFGKDADQYLGRHAKAGRLAKPRRGLYVVPDPPPSEVSETSEPQVNAPKFSDTPSDGTSEVSEPEDDA